MDTVVTKQPLVDEKQTISTPTDSDERLPIGLKQLEKSRSVTVTQLIDPVEVLCCCFARPCRYSVYVDEDTDHSLYIQEVSDCYARQIMGAARGFTLKFTDEDNVDNIRVIRPQTCSRGCCGICCSMPLMDIQSPPGVTIATVRERRTCCCPVYEIMDSSDKLLYVINPSCCYVSLVNLFVTDIEIEITDCDGELAAKLCKKTKLKLGECTGSANDFTIHYLLDLPVLHKCTILGSVFLIDYHYFERQNRCCC